MIEFAKISIDLHLINRGHYKMTDNTNSKDTAALMWILAIFFSWFLFD